MLRVAVIGCGLVGTRRAQVAREAGDAVTAVVDLDAERAARTARELDAAWSTDWGGPVHSSDVDAVVVSTFNVHLVEIAAAALFAGKHVLCEKPFGCTAAEARLGLEVARRSGRCLKVGFTLRHHPALARAHELVAAGSIGRPLGLRAAYGHGGRPGYEKEWRGNRELACGGELLDQGVHLIDLSRWFLGDFSEVCGLTGTWFWPVEPLEDNAFALLRTADGRAASLHTSWTQWKNLFRFELLGEDGHLAVEGLGGSYGRERLTLGRRRPEGGPPSEETWEFPDDGAAWRAEWADFVSAIRERKDPLGGPGDGYEAARIVDALYESVRSGRSVPLARETA